jgi:hypothetical protein
MPFTPHDFAAKWRGDTRKERSVSQEHFIDLCRLLGHETPGENRDGTLVFEAGVSKMGGGQGWADVWKQGVFAWEYKGPRAHRPERRGHPGAPAGAQPGARRSAGRGAGIRDRGSGAGRGRSFRPGLKSSAEG